MSISEKVVENIKAYIKIRKDLVLNKISSDGKPGFDIKGTRTRALIALGLVSFFWGTTWIASREGVKYMPALQLASIRQSSVVLPSNLFAAKRKGFSQGKDWITILILTS